METENEGHYARLHTPVESSSAIRIYALPCTHRSISQVLLQCIWTSVLTSTACYKHLLQTTASTLRPCPLHIASCLTDSPPTFPVCYPHYPHLYRVLFLPVWLLCMDCLTLTRRALSSFETSETVYPMTQRNVAEDLK